MFVTPPLISRINYCGPAAQNQTKQSSRVQHRSPALSLTRPISEKATRTLHMHTCTPRSTASHQTALPSDIERTVPSLSISLRVATPPHHTNHAIITEYGSVLYIMTASLCFFQASEKKNKNETILPYSPPYSLLQHSFPSLFSIISRAGNSPESPRQRDHIPGFQAAMLGLHGPVARILVCPQFGEGSQMGAAIYMGLQPGKLRQMVGRAEETRLQGGAFFSGGRVQAGGEYILG